MRNILIILIVTTMALLGLVLWGLQSGQRNSPVTDLILAIQRENTAPKKQELLNQLAACEPTKDGDFYALAKAQDPELRPDFDTSKN